MITTGFMPDPSFSVLDRLISLASTMYFNGAIVNNPTDGRSSGEREVSDIVYIGY